MVSRQRFFDEKGFHFFKAHLLQIARSGRAAGQTEIACPDVALLRHQNGAFDDVIQFANISRETMLQQKLARCFVEAGDLLAITL